MKPHFGRLSALVEIELRAYLVNKQSLVSSVFIQPLVYFLLLAGGLNAVVTLGGAYEETSYLAFVVPGLLALQAMRAMYHVVYRATIDRRWGLLAFKRLAGAGAMAYITAILVAPLVAQTIQTALLLLLASIMSTTYSWPNAVAGFVVSSSAVIFWAAAGIALTAFFRNYQQRDTVMTLLTLPLTFAAPVFYPLDSAPQYLRAIAAINPLSYQVEAAREAFLFGNIGWAFVVMVAMTTALTVIAVASLARGDMMQIGER